MERWQEFYNKKSKEIRNVKIGQHFLEGRIKIYHSKKNRSGFMLHIPLSDISAKELYDSIKER